MRNSALPPGTAASNTTAPVPPASQRALSLKWIDWKPGLESVPSCADMRVYAAFPQDLLKPDHIIGPGAAKRQPLDLIVTDEVDIRPYRAADFHQFTRVLGPVIYAGQEDVLQRDLAAGFLEVVAGGV